MHYIFAVFQRFHIVGIPLKHFTPAVYVLSVVVRPSNRVFIDVCQLRFYPRGVLALFVQDGTHSVPETVPGDFSVIANPLKDLVYAGFTHYFSRIVTAREHKRVIAC